MHSHRNKHGPTSILWEVGRHSCGSSNALYLLLEATEGSEQTEVQLELLDGHEFGGRVILDCVGGGERNVRRFRRVCSTRHGA